MSTAPGIVDRLPDGLRGTLRDEFVDELPAAAKTYARRICIGSESARWTFRAYGMENRGEAWQLTVASW